MLKTKLPVIVLRNMILLPHGEIKLEIQGEQDKNIIYRALNEHDGYVLLVSPKFATYEDIPKEDLPLFGIIGKITSNFELPNENIRITLQGINRARVFEFIDVDNYVLDAIIGPAVIEKEDDENEIASLRLLKKSFHNYISIIPNFNPYFITKVNEELSLDTLTDIIVNILPLKFEDKFSFIEETNSILRANSLLILL